LNSSSKPKLLIILNRLVIGGQALDTIPLIYHLQNDFDILVLYGQKESDEEDAFFLLHQYPGIKTFAVNHFKRSINPFTDFLAFIIIYREIKKFKCSIIHTHGFKSGLIGRIAARFARVPYVIHTFHGHLFHSYYNRVISKFIIWVEKSLGKITTRVIAISDTQKKELVEKYKIFPEKKVSVIYLGVDEKLFLKSQSKNIDSFRNEYNLTDQTVAIGIIGRLVSVKNYTLFVKVAENFVAENNRTVKFFVIGDGLLKHSIQEELDKKNILWCEKNTSHQNESAKIIFTSWIEDIAKAVQGLDIIMLTSHNEGTPMSLIEAQVCGKPVVATNVGGVKDTFINNETGFLVTANDAEMFTAKLKLLIDNRSLRETMGRRASLFASQRFSKQKEIDNFKALYKNC
jgi:glycosyltransferase involved in cell wall biosynthesis